MANLIPFNSWTDVLAYARTGKPLYYQAPMDHRAVRLTPASDYRYANTYEVRARTIKIWPSGSVGRGRSRTSDPFSADAGHLERFSRPEQGMSERRRVASPGARRVAARDPEITEIGHIGDTNWPEHGGGLIFRRGSDDNDCFLEYVLPREDYEERWLVYSVELEPGVPSWGDLKAVARSSGQSPKKLRAAFNSSDPIQRAWAYETWAYHYGWQEFDQYARRYTCAEMNERYPDADIDCGDDDEGLEETRSRGGPKVRKISDGTYRVTVQGKSITIALPMYMLSMFPEEELRREAIQSAEREISGGDEGLEEARSSETMQSLAWEADDLANQLGRPPNVVGFLQRVRDSEFYRPPPVGSPGDAPSREELKGHIAMWRGKLRAAGGRTMRENGSVDDPDYIIQGLYNDGTRASAEFGYNDEDKAIFEAKKLAKISGSNWFEGDYVRVITRDGELVWDSRRSRN